LQTGDRRFFNKKPQFREARPSPSRRKLLSRGDGEIGLDRIGIGLDTRIRVAHSGDDARIRVGKPKRVLGLKLTGPPVSSDINAPTGKARETEAIKLLDAIRIPNPAAVKIGQLDYAAMAIIKKLVEVHSICLKR
jgi:hypothetical protein